MTIKVGERIPEATLRVPSPSGPQQINTAEIFSGKKVVVFGVPGAFTPTCSNQHLPGFVDKAAQLKAKGVDTIACLSVNDAFVMGAWGEAQQASEMLMLADGNAEFTRSIGMDSDYSQAGMGVRAERFAMIVDDGVVSYVGKEQPRNLELSTADAILEELATSAMA